MCVYARYIFSVLYLCSSTIVSDYKNSMPTPTPKPLAVRSPLRPTRGIEKLTSILIGSSLTFSFGLHKPQAELTYTSSPTPPTHLAIYTSSPHCRQTLDLDVSYKDIAFQQAHPDRSSSLCPDSKTHVHVMANAPCPKSERKRSDPFPMTFLLLVNLARRVRPFRQLSTLELNSVRLGTVGRGVRWGVSGVGGGRGKRSERIWIRSECQLAKPCGTVS